MFATYNRSLYAQDNVQFLSFPSSIPQELSCFKSSLFHNTWGIFRSVEEVRRWKVLHSLLFALFCDLLRCLFELLSLIW